MVPLAPLSLARAVGLPERTTGWSDNLCIGVPKGEGAKYRRQVCCSRRVSDLSDPCAPLSALDGWRRRPSTDPNCTRLRLSHLRKRMVSELVKDFPIKGVVVWGAAYVNKILSPVLVLPFVDQRSVLWSHFPAALVFRSSRKSYSTATHHSILPALHQPHARHTHTYPRTLSLSLSLSLG
jgi:hypothetical protein